MTALGTGSTVRPHDKKRIGSLDGVRGLCAMVVVITHVAFSTGVVLGSESGPPQKGIWSILSVGAEVGLGPFFILSGMLLYKPFARATLGGARKPVLGEFFLRRGLRLMPAYWLLTAVCLLLLNFSSINSIWYVLRPILLMQDYDYVWYAGMDPTWTIPTEAQFYLVLPLLAWLMHWLAGRVVDPARKIRRMMIPLAVMIVVGFLFTGYMHMESMGPWPPEYWWPFSRLGLFGIGMGMAILSVRAEQSPGEMPALYRLAIRRPNLFWVGALVAYLVNCTSPLGKWGTWDYGTPQFAMLQHISFLAFAFLLMVPLVAPDASSPLMDRVLTNRPTRFLGRISYGIYLWHFVVMYLWFQSGSIFGAPPVPAAFLVGKVGFWEMLAVVVAGTLVLATVSYYFFERPLLNWGERVIKKRRDARSAADTGGSRPAVEENEPKRASV
ncbi:acyltransferase [Streptomyces sp. NBC_00654]|uniref:acyltransferase family protein n=1 Tax=Streptomyces sp. NBC_00654 TaxID=2975799 RepID=UPI00224D3C58|nr:acyltransferase [Streptomyces sp. NBC_00654]MCX4970656.1 acyltransferase [Streptomyces sp. NBC_00654]